MNDNIIDMKIPVNLLDETPTVPDLGNTWSFQAPIVELTVILDNISSKRFQTDIFLASIRVFVLSDFIYTKIHVNFPDETPVFP